MRTRHGIVLERVTVAGAPVAWSPSGLDLRRGARLDRRLRAGQRPGFVKDADSFARAFDGVDYVFNWFYADDRDISYFASGLLPRARAGVAPTCRGSATGSSTGRASCPSSARSSDQPAPGLPHQLEQQAGAGVLGGRQPVGLRPGLPLAAARPPHHPAAGDGGEVSRVELVEAMQDAAHTDLRAEVLLPLLLDVVGDDPRQRERIARCGPWDAERVDRDRTGRLRRRPGRPSRSSTSGGRASTAPSVAKEVLRGSLGDLTDELPQKLDDHPRLGLGSAWNGVAWYGYVSKDLRQVLGRPVTAPYSRTYCGGGGLEQCRTDLRASLSAAVARVLDEQGVDSVGDLTYDQSEDFIRSVTGGLVGVRPIDWQNRRPSSRWCRS
jgi:hypothetical protein